MSAQKSEVEKLASKLVKRPGKRGRPIEFHDDLHKYWRNQRRRYRARKLLEEKEQENDGENQ